MSSLILSYLLIIASVFSTIAQIQPSAPSSTLSLPPFFNEHYHHNRYEYLNFNDSSLWGKEGHLPSLKTAISANSEVDSWWNLEPKHSVHNRGDDGFLAPRNDANDQVVESADQLADFERWRESQPSTRLLWPKGASGFYEVPYVIRNGDFSKWMIEEMILWGMKSIERGSNIRFRPATPTDRNFVVFMNGEGCLSIVGRHPNPRPQRISLNVPGCMHRHAVLHEILHSLGLYHEHQRVDADQYVEIAPNAPPTWNQYVERDATIPTHLTPYNLASIMHYNLYLRAINPIYQSILDTRGATLSSCDWHHLNLLYPGPILPPPCTPHTRVQACEALPTCPYGLTLCKYMCDLDCDVGLPRGDVPDLVSSPAPFCQYVGGEEFAPLPEALQKQIDGLQF